MPAHRSHAPSQPHARLGARGAALLLIALAFMAYLPALNGAFLWDDHSLVEDSVLLKGPLWRIWFTTDPKDYWPLTWTSLWLEWRLWGSHPVGYHVTSVLLHGVTAVLLWQALKALKLPGAWLGAALFVVHPVAVESVAWISERKNTLSGALFVAAIWLFARGDAGRRARALVGALGLFALALLSKAAVVVLPVILVGIVWRRRRLSDVRHDVLRLAPFFVLSLGAGLTTLWFQHEVAMGGLVAARPWLHRLGFAGWALTSYVQKAFLPVDLGILYPAWPLAPTDARYGLPLLGLTVVAIGLGLVKHPVAVAARWALAFGTVAVFPVLGFVELSYFSTGPVSNHLQYLALMGAAAAWAALLVRLAERGRAGQGVVAAVIVVLGGYTAYRAGAFRDEATLWTRAVAEQPTAANARLQLGRSLLGGPRHAEAIDQMRWVAQHAVEDSARAGAEMTLALDRRDRDGALRAARRLLEVTDDSDLHRDAALTFLNLGDPAGAAAILAPLQRSFPRSPDYTYWLSVALVRAGRVDEALSLLSAFTQRWPTREREQQALAFLWLARGDEERALACAAALRKVPPSHPAARSQLAAWQAQPGWSRSGPPR